MAENDRLLTLKQVSTYLCVGRSWLIDHIRRGDLIAFRVGGTWRVSHLELRRFLLRNRSDRRAINPDRARNKVRLVSTPGSSPE
jgi:excisionase family DNA binding protein